MTTNVRRVSAFDRTGKSLDLEIELENSKIVKLQLDGTTAAAIVAAIVNHGPSMDPPNVLDFPCFGFATSPSAEGHLALAFQLSSNRYQVAIRVPHEKLPEIRAGIAKWENQKPGRA